MRWRFFEPSRKRLASTKKRLRQQLGVQKFERFHLEGQALAKEDIPHIPHPDRPASDPQKAVLEIEEPLTPREIEVLALLAEELSNPDIAEQLVISPRTVDAHCRSIYGKLNVTSRFAAVQAGREAGYL
jgi:DNA-binding NarL/FixJ family response regulator